MSATIRLQAIRYSAALLPAVAMLLVAVLINAHDDKTDRAQRVVDHARLAAASVDLRLGQLLELAAFCSTSPALIKRIDFESVAESCGRYASQIGAWVVLVETGVTHRQLLNTRVDAPAVLPVYPKENEQAPLLDLEKRSRSSGEPGIADVFTGIILPEGIVSAGQYLRLADGRDAMVYIGVSARTFSDQLAELSVPGGPNYGLIDPSHRVVARSVGIERTMFTDAPDWIIGFMETGAAGASLGVPGPEVTGGTWDAGYQPLEIAPGWMAAAFEPTPAGARLWAPLSLPSGVMLVGLLLSGLLVWGISGHDRTTRRLEAARQAKLEAERQNREKSRLLASFAHDIRSPLISLIGSLQIIEDAELAGNGQVRMAQGSAEALLQLVDDILELSFLGSGELTFHPSPVELREVARVLLEQTKQLADRKGLDLRLDLDPGIPPIVEVDRLRLQQVLANLLTNAVKYTDRGSITLRIRLEGPPSGHVMLDVAVIDTGIGLSPEDVPRILREFGRLERAAERREAGTGLGLAIVQRILHAMGTALSVKTAPGQGSTFSFSLVLPVLIGKSVKITPRPLSGITILYAEDEPVIRRVTVRQLEAAGARVVSAVDGQDALCQLANVTPDLLLVDINMPGLDGVELIRSLQDAAPDRAYPVYVLTSHISGPQAAEARAAGADAIFTKPVQVAALAAAFRTLHGNDGRSTPIPVDNPERTDERFLDPDTFRNVSGFQDPQATAALLADFEAVVSKDLTSLIAALDAGDMMLTGSLAHRALGLCLVVGALNLAQQLRCVEEAAVAGNSAVTRALLAKVEPILASTLIEMRSAFVPATEVSKASSLPPGSKSTSSGNEPDKIRPT